MGERTRRRRKGAACAPTGTSGQPPELPAGTSAAPSAHRNYRSNLRPTSAKTVFRFCNIQRANTHSPEQDRNNDRKYCPRLDRYYRPPASELPPSPDPLQLVARVDPHRRSSSDRNFRPVTGTSGPPRQQLHQSAFSPPPANLFLPLDPFTRILVDGLYIEPPPPYCIFRHD